MIYSTVLKFRDELKKILIDNGITQRQLAEKLNISPQQLTNLFSKKNFSFEDAKKIADALNMWLCIDLVKKP